MRRRGFTYGVSTFAASALVAGVLATGAAGAAPSTTEPILIYPVNVRLLDTGVKLDRQAVSFETVAQLKIRNRSRTTRTFAIGGFNVKIPRGSQRVLLLDFEIRGKYPYVSTGGGKTFRGVLKVV